jgi:peroxin-2
VLDEELIKMLREQSEKVLGMFSFTSAIPTHFRSEIDMCIRFIMWWFSIRTNTASPGEVLQNLRYRDERKFSYLHTKGLLTLPNDMPSRGQRSMHLLLSVLTPWMWNRLRDHAVEKQWGENHETEHWWSILEAVDRAHRVASLVNFLIFLGDGRYRNITDRLLKMRLIPARNESVRAVSFELINQQLLFEGFSEILLVILPLVDWSAFARSLGKLRNLLRKLLMLVTPQRVIDFLNDKLGGSPLTDASGSPDQEMKCVSCGASPAIMPHRAMPCEHVYCYFCLKTASSRLQTSCVSCEQTFEGAERV